MIRHGYDQESEPMSRLLGSSPHVEDMRYPSESRYGLFERLVDCAMTWVCSQRADDLRLVSYFPQHSRILPSAIGSQYRRYDEAVRATFRKRSACCRFERIRLSPW